MYITLALDKDGRSHKVPFSREPSDMALTYIDSLMGKTPWSTELDSVITDGSAKELVRIHMALTVEDYAIQQTRNILMTCAAILSESGLIDDGNVADALEQMARIIRERNGQ